MGLQQLSWPAVVQLPVAPFECTALVVAAAVAAAVVLHISESPDPPD